jgi:peptidoglycan/LPS O-acetylase OafA/YrhL
MDNKTELRGLTIARFFAAILVVLFHFRKDLGQIPQALNAFLSSGYTCVAFFFILSGFILVYVTGDKGVDTRGFLIRRFARLYPVYVLAWAVFGLWLVADWSLEGIYRAARGNAVPGFFSLLMLQSWVPGMPLGWNLPGWSLSTEAFFYASFPIIYRYMVKAPDRTLWWVLVAMFAVNAAHLYAVRIPGEILVGTRFEDKWGSFAAYLPVFRVQQFIAGMVVGFFYLRHRRHIPWLLPVSFGGAAALWFFPDLPVPRDIWLTPLYCALIYSLAWVPANGLAGHVGVLLGKASYSIYILHVPLWHFLERVLAPSPMRLAFFCVALTGISIVTYQWFERPLEKWIKRRFSQRAAPVLAAGAQA